MNKKAISMMTASSQNMLFSIITIVFLVPFFLGFTISPVIEIAIFTLSLVITGIPHGAIDHVIFQQKTRIQGSNHGIWLHFFLPYLTLITITMLVWFWIPAFMFWFFLVISAYHFGQSQLYHIQLSETSPSKILLYFFWGIFLLSALWLFNWDAYAPKILSIFSWDLNTESTLHRFLRSTAIVAFTGTLLGLSIMVMAKKISLIMCLQEIFILGLLTLLLKYTSLYVAFALYFGLWHSTRVIITEYGFLCRNVQVRPSFASFIKAFIPFSLLSIVGLGVLLLAAQYINLTIAPFMLFMVFISALTMPHAYFMHGMYKVLQKKSYKNPL